MKGIIGYPVASCFNIFLGCAYKVITVNRQCAYNNEKTGNGKPYGYLRVMPSSF
jgi:hypothetical protein